MAKNNTILPESRIVKHPVQEIAEESLEAAGLVGEIMERNYEEQVRIQERIREELERELEQERELRIAAEERLARIEDRLYGLLR